MPRLFSLIYFFAAVSLKADTSLEVVQPVCPVFIREEYNPVVGFRIDMEDKPESKLLEEIELSFAGTTRVADIQSFRVYQGGKDPSMRPFAMVAEGRIMAETLTVKPNFALKQGPNWFWVSPILTSTASIDGRIDASVFQATVGGKIIRAKDPSPVGCQRIGYAVRLPGDDGSKSYRIPGLARTTAGSLLAVYDIRYGHAGDLPADIDVGVSRSVDGGESWEAMRVPLDFGKDPKYHYDGVGDPAVLVDPSNSRVWIAALWSHGNHAWNGSKPGISPEETGQFILTYSDDDGKTWSAPVNITRSVKNPEWRLFFNAPGAGIAMKDGTLVFAAQYRAADGQPWSTIIRSKDHGKTWSTGTGVKSDTTEAQVVELSDGVIMINCRDNRGGTRTIATSKDLGTTWEMHPGDRKVLRDPVCMGSLATWKTSEQGKLLAFSNPDSDKDRKSMTLKLSTDEGQTWPESFYRLYDSRRSFGYSCLTALDENKIGVLYEGNGTIYFLRFPLNEWFQ